MFHGKHGPPWRIADAPGRAVLAGPARVRSNRPCRPSCVLRAVICETRGARDQAGRRVVLLQPACHDVSLDRGLARWLRAHAR